MGDGDAVVGKGDPGVGGSLSAVLHFPLIEHAAAAVDDKAVGGKRCV